jgi:hypothetical protein
MPFITQGKTNWKFLLIVIILAVIVGGGTLWYAKRPEKSYQPIEIKKSETVDWKNYQNLKAGFSAKCPPDFECILGLIPTPDDEPYGRDVIISNFFKKSSDWRKKDLIFISIESWTEFSSYANISTFQDWVEYRIEDIKSNTDSQLKQEDFTLDNNPATRLSFVNFPYEDWIGRIIFTQKGKRFYEISVSIDPEYQTIYLPVFDQILSTFRFIE